MAKKYLPKIEIRQVIKFLTNLMFVFEQVEYS